MNFFDSRPEFVELDPRKNRTTHSYAVSADFYQKRYEAMLPQRLLAGRSIVDVGCALGAAGAWALSNGAKSYIGIDVAKDYVEAAKELFSRYYSEHNWGINLLALEEASNVFESADIILCAGAIYAHANTAEIIRQFSTANTVIIESMHPTTLNTFGQSLITSQLYQSRSKSLPELLKAVETEYSYIQINPNMNMVLGLSGGELIGYPAGVPSIGALNDLFSVYGFSMDLTAYETLKNTLPGTYNFFSPGTTTSRFCATFNRVRPRRPQSFVDVAGHPQTATYREFQHK